MLFPKCIGQPRFRKWGFGLYGKLLPVAGVGADADADAVGHSYLVAEYRSHFSEPAVAVAAETLIAKKKNWDTGQKSAAAAAGFLPKL